MYINVLAESALSDVSLGDIEILGNLLIPALALFVAWSAASTALETLQQKTESDKRSDWWERFAWANDKVTSDDLRDQEVGSVALGELIDSDLLAAETDKSIIYFASRQYAVAAANAATKDEAEAEEDTRDPAHGDSILTKDDNRETEGG